MSTWFVSPRSFVMVEGPDAATFLHSQLSQEVRDLSVGEARWTLLLQPTGKLDVLARVLRSGDHAFVLDTDEGWGDHLVERLLRFKIRVKADVTAIDWSAVSLLASDGEQAASQSDSGAQARSRPGAVAVGGWWGSGIDLIGPAPIPLDAPAVSDPGVYRRARVAVGWPAMGAEITPGETIPGELPILGVAVSFTKGCYPGQELVERMDSRAAVAPRLLRRLVLAEVPAHGVAGAEVRSGGVEVGVVTSVAGDLALASVRRTVEPPADVEVIVSGVPVAARLEAISQPGG